MAVTLEIRNVESQDTINRIDTHDRNQRASKTLTPWTLWSLTSCFHTG